MPDYLDLSEEEINKYWGQWLLWRATGRRLDFDAAQKVPARMLHVIMLLDDLYARLEVQHDKNKHSGTGDVNAVGR